MIIIICITSSFNVNYIIYCISPNQVIVSKKHIQYFNPKELKKKTKKDKKLEKRRKKKKELKNSPVTTKRNGSVASKNR